MKKKLLFPSLLLAVVMLLTCVVTLGVGAEETMTMTEVQMPESEESGKTPVAGDIVTISDADELKKFSAYVSKGGVTEGITFRLESDIELKAIGSGMSIVTNHNPIGGVLNDAKVKEPVPFKGIFDGNGKTVSNIYFTARYRLFGESGQKQNGNTSYTGFFALLGEGAVVKDLTVSVAATRNIKCEYMGLIASKAEGATILNCFAKGQKENTQLSSITSSVAAAGIVGYAKNCVIDGCTTSVDFSASQSVGGIVGVAEDTAIRNCVTSGTYTHANASILGGVAAKILGGSVVENSYSSVVLSNGLMNDLLGGVVGYVGEGATVANCFSNVSVATGYSFVFGSLVGENNGTVNHSYALRDAALTNEQAHADIGTNNGTAEEVFAYQPKTEEGVTTFIVGTVLHETIDKKDIYTFVPAEGENVSLVDALNAWVTENETDSVSYQAWVVNGTTIVNCKHANFVYRAYAGQEATCSSVGHGDKHCAGCGLLMEENVEIPVNPKAHNSESGVVYDCLAYDCIYCHETIEASKGHRVENIPCKDQSCAVCGTFIEGNGEHVRPADFDESKPCMEYFCTACNEQVHEADHDAPEVKFDCQTSTCSVCGYTIPAKKFHRPGRAANCTRSQTCLDCHEVIRKAKGHTWDEENPASCGAAQLCVECGAENPDAPATGEHIYQLEAPTCLESMVCVNCKFTPTDGRALGHSLNAEEHVDCGHGVSCTRCASIIETATGDHLVNWAEAVVIRPATAERTGIVAGICAECGRTVEAYTTYAVMENKGNALVMGGSFTFYAGSRVTAHFGTVADYKDVAYAEGYLPLQVVTLSVVDASNDAVSVSGGVTVKVALNKSVAKMAIDTIKLYQVVDGQATEVTITSVEEGFVTFSADSMGTFVLAGEKTAAFTVLGTLPVQAQQTAALIGTPTYDRRDYDI